MSKIYSNLQKDSVMMIQKHHSQYRVNLLPVNYLKYELQRNQSEKGK
jgi:hypothetical protein